MFDLPIRIGMTLAHRVRLLIWRTRRSPAVGVHAVPVTPQGRAVLVRLTYATGWHLPGGGWNGRETLEEGALRELREEIGLTAWSRVTLLEQQAGEIVGRPHRAWLFMVEGAVYRPRWSLEVAEVAEFPLDAPPNGLSAAAAAMLPAAAAALRGRDAASIRPTPGGSG